MFVSFGSVCFFVSVSQGSISISVNTGLEADAVTELVYLKYKINKAIFMIIQHQKEAKSLFHNTQYQILAKRYCKTLDLATEMLEGNTVNKC